MRRPRLDGSRKLNEDGRRCEKDRLSCLGVTPARPLKNGGHDLDDVDEQDPFSTRRRASVQDCRLLVPGRSYEPILFLPTVSPIQLDLRERTAQAIRHSRNTMLILESRSITQCMLTNCPTRTKPLARVLDNRHDRPKDERRHRLRRRLQ